MNFSLTLANILDYARRIFVTSAFSSEVKFLQYLRLIFL
jgi:hypothetical protein